VWLVEDWATPDCEDRPDSIVDGKIMAQKHSGHARTKHTKTGRTRGQDDDGDEVSAAPAPVASATMGVDADDNYMNEIIPI